MTALTPDQFAKFYEAVHGYAPFPWQSRLAAQVCGGKDWPRAIALPTAAGKTACIDVAVFALACGVKTAPRRIFFVVDRRIVVDQAKLHADDLADKLLNAKSGILKTVADLLREVAHPGWRELPETERQYVRPLDVYALRGGMYRETAWARSPLQPTVIASTVDQVGSRLLFRGYGVSDSMKPVHAALVGNDALILLDEAHCAKPFDQTVRAVENYRGWNDSPAPFRFVSITATPTTDGEVMRDDETDRGHAVLGKRIAASKPAKLVVAEKAKGKKFTPELVKELKKQAEELAKSAECVGIIVNRVKTARELKAALGGDAVLLTGRMRPLDRDRLFDEKLKPLLSNSETQQKPPKFVIGTQCLEVGADFDFHALVTECASLDALRQRFGRLNRVAKRDQAEAVVVIRGDQTEPKEKEAEQDPIYGDSLPNTWKFLTDEGKRTEFDFGVAAVRDILEAMTDDERAKLLEGVNAPTENAPVLFPAHLDCWVQTHPIPHPDPDVSVFLHGPKQTGQPDVQVVLRDDLGDDPEKWAEVVTLIPPSSSEAVAVPIGLFKKWIAGENLAQADPGADIEGGASVEDTDPEPTEPRAALCWVGTADDETVVVSDPTEVRPNRTYAVRTQATGVAQLADFITDPPADYAEEAFQRSRDKAVLRLKGVSIPEDAGKDDEEQLVSEAIRSLGEAQTNSAPAWERRAVTELSDPKKRIVEPHPTGGLVVTGKRRLYQFDPEFLDDANSSYSPGRAVTLEDHSRGVAERAGAFAAALKLDADLYRQAGFYHDLGKLDRRFQAMLKNGSPQTAVGTPLAKSAKWPRTNEDRTAAREVHRYPKGARHELLSTAILKGRTDDLLLHLIATHHGSARPFAAPVDENDAAGPFRVKQFGLEFNHPTSAQDIAGWNAELPERFWRVVRKHGWWGSVFREAVFRLADHSQSRAEQEKDWSPAELAGEFPPPPLRPFAEPQRLYPLPLIGLDGSNPLAFLAALGTLRLANRIFHGTRMNWQLADVWSPVLHLPREVSTDELIAELLRVADLERRCVTFAPDLKLPAEQFVHFSREGVGSAHADREFADFLRAYADPLVTVQGGPNAGKTKPTEFYFIAGQQKLLEIVRAIGERTQPHHLWKCLLESWVHDDAVEKLSVRWDPADDSRYATRWRNPSGDPTRKRSGSVLGANRLAFEALPLFPCFASGNRLVTTGFIPLNRSPHFSWPLWSAVWDLDTVRSLLTTTHPPKRRAVPQQVILPSQLGVHGWFQCEKVANSDYSNFSPSRAVE